MEKRASRSSPPTPPACVVLLAPPAPPKGSVHVGKFTTFRPDWTRTIFLSSATHRTKPCLIPYLTWIWPTSSATGSSGDRIWLTTLVQ
jgi:hypothetical protein